MKSEDEKWLDALRGKVEGYTESPGDALWQRIENDLPAPHQRRPLVVWLRVASVAACLALLLGVATVLFQSREERSTGVDAPAIAHSSPSASQVTAVKSTTAVSTSLIATARPATITATSQTASVLPSDNGVSLQAYALGNAASTQEIQQPQSSPQERPIADTIGNRHPVQRSIDEKFIRPMNTECTVTGNTNAPRKTTAVKYVNEGKWHVALAASNTMWGGDRHSTSGFTPLRGQQAGLLSSSPTHMETTDFQRVYSTTLANTIDEPTSTTDRIDFPVNVSFSVRYMLTSHWGINAGVSYSRSSSERRSGTSTDYYSQRQQMHFIGVPISVSFTFFKSRYVTAYALAGGDIEKCVYAVKKEKSVASSLDDSATRSDKLDIHPWQGTAFAGAGLQLNVTDRYGIFAEPQLAVDLSKKNSTPVKRRDDISFLLAVGIRMTY